MGLTLKELKQKYEELAKKYKLPDFREINENFEIEKIDSDTDCLARAIRKVIMEKIVNSLGFIELLLNPVNVPRMYIPFLKTMTLDNKKEMERIYDTLSEVVLAAVELEMEYDEKKEAELIIKANEKWKSVKPGFKKVIGSIKNPPISNSDKSKSYFG